MDLPACPTVLVEDIAQPITAALALLDLALGQSERGLPLNGADDVRAARKELRRAARMIESARRSAS